MISILNELNIIYKEEKIFGLIKNNITETLIAIYIPDFEELCDYKILDTTILINNQSIKLLDIRYLKKYINDYIIDFNNIIYNNNFIVNNYYQDIYNEINYIKNQNIDKLISTIIEYSLNSETPVICNTFIETLTELELIVLKYIISSMDNNETIVSISKAIEQTKVSRPVFKNLFNKLSSNNIAEITNLGVKGTSIKLINKDLINYL